MSRPALQAGFFLLLVVPALFAPLRAEDWRFEGIRRVVAISDVHGAFVDMVATLQQAGVIDWQQRWSGEDTHLVITGDLLDRGADSRRVMDLVMALEQEALAVGGRVHVLLGNHEVMNLVGDLRYVADGEFAAFAGEESSAERRYWRRHYVERRAAGEDATAAASTFRDKAPPGFFGHRNAFSSSGSYGGWLLSRPLMVVINDTAYVHGGLPSYVTENGLAGVNVRLKADVVDFVRLRAELEQAAILNPVDGLREVPELLERFLATDRRDQGQLAVVRELIVLRHSPIHFESGPLWYRGSSRCGRFIESDRLDAALARIGANRVVVGHTTTATRRVQQRLHGRVIEINTGMLKPSYGGSGFALIIEDDEVSVSGQDGSERKVPVVVPRRVGHDFAGLDDDKLAGKLANVDIRATSLAGNRPRLLSVAIGKQRAIAQFFPAGEDGTRPELAAYRLDRLLDLDRIPVTVPFSLDGNPGSLQLLPAERISERERFSQGIQADGSCELERQTGVMRIFDALAGNPVRDPSSILYSKDRWELMLVGHSAAFDRDSELNWPDGHVAPRPNKAWQHALHELSDSRLHESLRDTLDDQQLAALSRRRDHLLNLARGE